MDDLTTQFQFFWVFVCILQGTEITFERGFFDAHATPTKPIQISNFKAVHVVAVEQFISSFKPVTIIVGTVFYFFRFLIVAAPLLFCMFTLIWYIAGFCWNRLWTAPEESVIIISISSRIAFFPKQLHKFFWWLAGHFQIVSLWVLFHFFVPQRSWVLVMVSIFWPQFDKFFHLICELFLYWWLLVIWQDKSCCWSALQWECRSSKSIHHFNI